MASVVRYNRWALEQIVGRERNQRACHRQLVRNVVVSRRVNSTVGRLLLDMSSAEEQNKENLTRRDFLLGAAAIVAGVSMLGSEVMSQQSNVPVVKALDNPN